MERKRREFTFSLHLVLARKRREVKKMAVRPIQSFSSLTCAENAREGREDMK